MPIPEFILKLRSKVGHDLLWLPSATAVVTRRLNGRPEVLLIRRRDTGRWASVGGIVEPGEEPHLAVIREVREEASVTARIDRLAWLSVTGPVTYANGDVSQYVDHTFACTWLSGTPAVGDDECTDAAFFEVDSLPEMPDWHRERIDYVLSGDPGVRLGSGCLR